MRLCGSDDVDVVMVMIMMLLLLYGNGDGDGVVHVLATDGVNGDVLVMM